MTAVFLRVPTKLLSDAVAEPGRPVRLRVLVLGSVSVSDPFCYKKNQQKQIKINRF
jgi:hypothetical protein